MLQIYTNNQIDEIAFELKNNKCIVLPTDTVWGVVSLDDSLIYKIKKRKKSKKLVKFVNNLFQINNLDKNYIKILDKYLPGALTFVFKKQAYRIPNNDLILDLINQVGPLFSSSANISGKTPINNLQEAIDVFGKYSNVVCFVDDNEQQAGFSALPSTIVDLDRMIILRQGVIDGNKILQEIDQARR